MTFSSCYSKAPSVYLPNSLQPTNQRPVEEQFHLVLDSTGDQCYTSVGLKSLPHYTGNIRDPLPFVCSRKDKHMKLKFELQYSEFSAIAVLKGNDVQRGYENEDNKSKINIM